MKSNICFSGFQDINVKNNRVLWQHKLIQVKWSPSDSKNQSRFKAGVKLRLKHRFLTGGPWRRFRGSAKILKVRCCTLLNLFYRDSGVHFSNKGIRENIKGPWSKKEPLVYSFTYFWIEWFVFFLLEHVTDLDRDNVTNLKFLYWPRLKHTQTRGREVVHFYQLICRFEFKSKFVTPN